MARKLVSIDNDYWVWDDSIENVRSLGAGWTRVTFKSGLYHDVHMGTARWVFYFNSRLSR